MSLASGTRLGPYEILGLIGALRLRSGQAGGPAFVRCFNVAPDGQRFYAMQARNPPPPPMVTHINLVFNWFEELKAKVPVR